MLLEYASSADAPEIAKLLMKLQSCMVSDAPCSRMEAAVVDVERPANVDAIIMFAVGFDRPPYIAMAPPAYADAWKNFVLETNIELECVASKKMKPPWPSQIASSKRLSVTVRLEDCPAYITAPSALDL